MTDLHARLTQCFATTFPDLPAAAIPQATQSSVADWDSVASITLMSLIEEDFGIPIDFERIPELTSFAKIAGYLESQSN